MKVLKIIIPFFLIIIILLVILILQNNTIINQNNQKENNQDVSTSQEIENTNNAPSSTPAINDIPYNPEPQIIGYIEIPKTDTSVPIYSEVTKDTLNDAVGLLYSTSGLNQIGNTTILGSDYFDDNNSLSEGDTFYITDSNNLKIEYEIYNIYAIEPSDTDYLERDINGKREITLVSYYLNKTDKSKTRLIICAKDI